VLAAEWLPVETAAKFVAKPFMENKNEYDAVGHVFQGFILPS
jgi:uncharacterized membrane protein YjdF